MSPSAPTGLTVWWDDPADGSVNMAADEWLAQEADRRGGMLLRFYGWAPTTVSLGAFQRIADAGVIADLRDVPLVRRPSGGGAIVHGSDLTYAIAVPKSHPWGATPQVLYDAMHGAMAAVLADHGVVAMPYRPDHAAAPAADGEADFFCFDRRSVGDLVLAADRPQRGGTKIMGSAQRRLAGVVLQHGSLLLRGNEDVSGAARHPGIAEAAAMASLPTVRELSRAWVGRIAAVLGGRVREESGPWPRDRAEMIEAAAERFREPRWTCRR